MVFAQPTGIRIKSGQPTSHIDGVSRQPKSHNGSIMYHSCKCAVISYENIRASEKTAKVHQFGIKSRFDLACAQNRCIFAGIGRLRANWERINVHSQLFLQLLRAR